MRVLISAYACSPGQGSEPGVGWNWVCQISRFHEVWVITRANNREPIEAALAKQPLENVHWIYFDLPRWARFWKKRRRGIHLYYYLWQLGAFFVVRKLHRQIRFDLTHHVTFVNYWMPSFLPLLPAPFVWGPVGGGESAPRSFWYSLSLRGKTYEILRDLVRSLAELDPFVRLIARRAAWALSTTEDTKRRLEALGCRSVLVHSGVGLPENEICRLNTSPMRQSMPFRVVSIGNLRHFKGFELGLKAFAQFHSQFPASEYWIIGEGPERKRLRRWAERLGVAENVTFWGAMPRSQVLGQLSECDALLHPSLHDSGGWVCLEAMAAGRPVICLDLGGPAVQVTEENGIKIPAVSPEQVITDLAAAMSQLARDAARRHRLGTAGRQRVAEHFGWNRKGDFLKQIYQYSLRATSKGCHT